MSCLSHRIRLAFAVSLLACVTLALPVRVALAKTDTPPILLANVLRPEIDPALYLVSEKYDGVRAIWDGTQLKFRSGRVVAAPPWFLAKLPADKLDGELWLARGKFEVVSGIVRKTEPIDAEWSQVKYMVFELPDAPGSFAARAEKIQALVRTVDWPQLVAIAQTRIATREGVQTALMRMVASGGEGLMLHLADAPYVTGRSDVLLKLKPLEDTEARVIAHVAGRGKNVGVMGALRVEMPDGKRFVIGTGFSDSVRRNPPPVGSLVTYTYRGLTKNGLPRFASFVRLRDDP